MKEEVCRFLGILFIVLFAFSAVFEVSAVGAAPSIAWSQIYPDYGTAYSVIQTGDGGFLTLCSRAEPFSFYLLKTDSSGNQQWNRTFQGTVSSNSLVQTSDGATLWEGCIKTRQDLKVSNLYS